MRYLLIIMALICLSGDDPPDTVKVDTIRIQQQQAIEQTKKSRSVMDSLIKELREKQDTTKK